MDSLHGKQINRPMLRAKEIAGHASTKRTISTLLRRRHLHELRWRLSPCCDEAFQNTKAVDIGNEGVLPPLHNSSNIRLIKVLPELKEGQPQCRVSIHSIDESFMTLSYTWGSPVIGHTIWLNEIKFSVRCHLWQFLFVASHTFPNVLLWIDALCIDQINTNERSEQVRRMGDIYAASTKTLTFLSGSDRAINNKTSETSEGDHKLRNLDRDVQKSLEALKAREEIHFKDERSYLSEDEAFDESSLLSVLRIIFIIVCNARWARLWVIQENILSGASNTIILNDITACRYFEGISEKAQKPSADGQTVTIQAVSASPDLGILDLVFGDDSERKMLATIIQKDSTSEYETDLNITGSRTPADVLTNVSLLCKHCQRYVTLESDDSMKLQMCVVQCHRQLHVLGEIKGDHYFILVDGTRYNCRVEAATSWVNPSAHAISAGLFAVNDRENFSLDQVLLLVCLDEFFHH